MPIISKVEAKSPRGKILYAVIILALLMGGVTILYPFAVMISGSLRSELDETDLNLLPAYFVNHDVLYRKFLETKYNQNVLTLNRAHGERYFSFRDPLPPKYNDAERDAALLQRFMTETQLPVHWQVLGGIYGVRTVPPMQRELRRRLAARFNRDVNAFTQEVGVAVTSWNTIVLPVPAWTTRRYDYAPNAIYDVYFELLHEADAANIKLVSIAGLFLESMIYPIYGSSTTDAYNAAHAVPLESFSDFRLPATVPGEDQPTLRTAWIEFVRQELNPNFITVVGASDEAYVAYLRELYAGDLAELNRVWGSTFEAFADIRLPGREWLSGAQRQDYQHFLDDQPIERLTLIGPEYAWQTWLVEQGLTPGVDAPALPPMAALEHQYVLAHAGPLRRAAAVRNYINVFDELVLEGRALANTILFCILAISTALLINPLAAYAMSRFRLPGTYKILLILMATMAFPPMVTLIPQFILLRELNLLNTFVALVLPLAANGYLIFLLKGFFDSLPQELYEAARIDGAGEIRMFFQITMALSKPILAVLALMTFNSAYMMFLYPLLVAPSENMWLIAVWLFQFQQRASSSGVFASVIIASIPTLIVFLLAQRVIMRGIVVPTEK